jgi:MoaA/NifB/PqqE/SkfB family radical SAM enzyme
MTLINHGLNFIKNVSSNTGSFKVSFIVTYKCNYRCVNCSIWQIYRDNPDSQRQELNIKEYNLIFKNLAGYTSAIDFTGGEPFLKKDFSEIIISSLRLIKPLTIYIPTNGYSTRKIINTVGEVINSREWKESSTKFYMGVSIDGSKKLHNLLRGNPHAYTYAWKTFNDLTEISKKESRFKPSIASTIFKQNTGDIMSFLNMMQDNNISYDIQCFFEHAYLYGSANEKRKYDQNFKKWLAGLSSEKEFRRYIYNSGLLQKFYWLGLINQGGQMPISCPALKGFCAIDPEGWLMPCLLWPVKIVKIRDYNYDIKKIVRKNHSVSNLRKAITNKECLPCWAPCGFVERIIYSMIKKPNLTIPHLLKCLTVKKVFAEKISKFK